jgi:type IV pilus assembly protein PilV
MAEMIRAWSAPGDDRPFLFDYRNGETLPPADDCTGGALCDPSALRRFGIAQWLDAVRTALPMARVSICRDATPWNSADDAAQWACSGGGNAGIVIKLGWRAEPGGSDAPQLVLNVGEPAA